MRALAAIMRRDLVLGFRAGGGALQTALFFALVALVFALAIGPDRVAMAQMAAPILWTAALLSATISLDRIFQADHEDGSLDIMLATSQVLEARFVAKAMAHWLSSLAPLIAAAPLVGLLLNLPAEKYWPLLASLLVGTPALSLIGAAGAALTLSMRRAGVLVSILVAPLYAPTLIFGVGAAAGGDAGASALLLLGAATFFAAAIAPLAGVAAIRFNTA